MKSTELVNFLPLNRQEHSIRCIFINQLHVDEDMNGRLSFLILGMLLSDSVNGQNLVSNPSYETYSACPTSVAQLPNATGWLNVSGHGGSADFLHVCTTSTLVDVPSNAFGNQAAATGNGYIGFAMYYQSTANFREYVQTQLISPMVAGQTYTIQFKASLSDNSQYSAPCFQFYFSSAPLTWSGGGWGPITSVTPQLSSSNHITSKTMWTTFTDVYTATGGEQYMTMGNYRNDASTPGITPAGPGTYSTVYYYIDDFSITSGIPLPIELINFNLECSANGTEIKWSTASESSNDYFTIETSEDGTNYTAVATINGQGNSSEVIEYSYISDFTAESGQYFRLSQTDENGNVHYFEPEFIICTKPQPFLCPLILADNNWVRMEINTTKEENVEIKLIDCSGRIINSVIEKTVTGKNTFSLNTYDLSPGIYLITAISESHKCTTKFLLQK